MAVTGANGLSIDLSGVDQVVGSLGEQMVNKFFDQILGDPR